MLRKLLILAAVAGVLAAPGSTAPRQQLMPGVTYEREVQFTRFGPVVIHVVDAPRPVGNYALEPVLSNNSVSGRERLTAIERRLAASATGIAGVNGDLYFADGRPHGILMQDGVLHYAPARNRTSLGIDANGTLRVAEISLNATWSGTGQRRPLVGLNRPPGPNGVSLFTPAWGGLTPPAGDTVEVVLSGLPPTAPGGELVGTVARSKTGGATTIPRDGAVLVGRGTQGRALAAEAAAGTAVTVRLLVDREWAGVVDSIGGGPLLVRDGKAVFRARENFSARTLALRQARTAVGQRADGRLLLVAVDGGRLGSSVGMTNYELARTLVRLGAVTGYALAGGQSSVLAADGRLLNRPRGSEPALADALLLVYRPRSR